MTRDVKMDAQMGVSKEGYALLRQSKGKLIDRLRDVDEETVILLFDGLAAALDFHKQAVKILEAAQGRILVAGSWLEANEWEHSHEQAPQEIAARRAATAQNRPLDNRHCDQLSDMKYPL